jgi:hypothetical protein
VTITSVETVANVVSVVLSVSVVVKLNVVEAESVSEKITCSVIVSKLVEKAVPTKVTVVPFAV